MGQSQSKTYIVEDCIYHKLSNNKKLRMTNWDFIPPKNIEYYSGERFFKVSRSLYTNNYTKGYIYGYYDNPDKEQPILDENNERVF